MRTFDFSPLFRSTVGFDRLARLLDTAVDEQSWSYPPYNIEKMGENQYRITMAVAGFSEADLDITSQDHTLVVAGRGNKGEATSQYLHRGLAARAFERRFELAEHIRVSGATLANGLLHIDLVREVPEALRPRKIEIGTAAAQPQAIETQKAA